ncbi:MAG: enoyl-CoA hydratase/isomerase family protein [Deltaproteobacteria bacterium]|nr:enoyl-CoA hydratase/isomerase family protein [Deltaproteobacteria bacterium]MBW1812800.1 enoyl-CoA hydratase/isomerase family protein [Deltaproteobacteria bacterium]MBW1846858.1 enoyl-CoA hydratase/isomerase family protein [Deltaproteobacteria bacterium]MBW2179862.1 enoyl-CoA hydratase/isomerase family protein [Deltaproteobacteria bacterium]MBW2364495.1 enoyl-CoA hydratase/isomerase family protein [Deltaproteobacteria bacterium]
MGTIEIEANDHVAVLRFNNGVSNTVSSDFVNDLSDALKRTKNEFKGQVITGGEKFFSIGLNLPELLTFDRFDMTDFWYRFNQAIYDIYTHPLPTAAAIAGHAPAAGTIFAIASDYRFAAEGRKLIGLNEVKLGIPVPYIAVLMLSQILRNQAAMAMLYQGEFIEPAYAKEIGLIDQIVEQDKVEDRALEKIKEIAAMPAPALHAVKANRVEDIRVKFERNHKEQHEIFLNCWFSDSTQELLAKAAENFKPNR